MKALHIIESAYRATVEEQDDTIVWLTHAMRGTGATLSVLLRANAVNYAIGGQAPPALRIGGWQQTQPPRIADDVAGLMAKQVPVFAVAEDLDARGLGRAALLPGIERIERAKIADLVLAHDQVWHW
jgi:hypothetical protein